MSGPAIAVMDVGSSAKSPAAVKLQSGDCHEILVPDASGHSAANLTAEEEDDVSVEIGNNCVNGTHIPRGVDQAYDDEPQDPRELESPAEPNPSAAAGSQGIWRTHHESELMGSAEGRGQSSTSHPGSSRENVHGGTAVCENVSEPSSPPRAGSQVTTSHQLYAVSSATNATSSVESPTSMTRDQLRYCTSVVRNMKRSKKAHPFLEPVDPMKLNIPNYHTIIKKPMDLGTVEKKLASNAYASIEAFSADVRQIFHNCYLYNGKESPYSVMAASLGNSFENQMKRLPVASSGTPRHHSASARRSVELPTAGQTHGVGAMPSASGSSYSPISFGATSPQFAQPAATPADRQRAGSARKRKTLPKPKSKHSSSSSSISAAAGAATIDPRLKFCSSVLLELSKKTHSAFSYPFMQPVDHVALGIPDYPLIIKKPMDISSIRRKYDAGQYATHVEFEEDVKLMFDNCFAYNKAGDPVYVMGKRLQQVFLNKWKELPAPPVKPPKAATPKTASKPAVKPSAKRTTSTTVPVKQKKSREDEDELEGSSDSESEDAETSVFGKNLEQIALMEAHMSMLQKRLLEMKDAATSVNTKRKKKSKNLDATSQLQASAKSKSGRSKTSKGESSTKTKTDDGSRGKSKNKLREGGGKAAGHAPGGPYTTSAAALTARKKKKRRTEASHSSGGEDGGNDHGSASKGDHGDGGSNVVAGAGDGRSRPAKKAKVEPPVIHFAHKQELSELINYLAEDRLEVVIEIIHESMPHLHDAGTEELELDIDSLDYTTFYNLYNYVVKGVRPTKKGSTSQFGSSGKGSGGKNAPAASAQFPQSTPLSGNFGGAHAEGDTQNDAASAAPYNAGVLGSVEAGLQRKHNLDPGQTMPVYELEEKSGVPSGNGAAGDLHLAREESASSNDSGDELSDGLLA